MPDPGRTPALKSALAEVRFPALPRPRAAAELALLYQLEHSQWWEPERIEREQLRQLQLLVAHAAATVPFYRERMRAAGIDPRAPLAPEAWSALPLLTRRDVQESAEALVSSRIPRAHGRTYTTQTSGSTGQPVRITGTSLNRLLWRVLTVREHLWHRRDFSAKLCAIRPSTSGHARPPEGLQRQGWGPATDGLFRTGPMALLALGTDVGTQAAWLVRQDPEYLLSYPSNLLALAEHFLRAGLRLPRLREVRTVGESVQPALREAVRAAWNVPVTDVYSSQEAGYIALQCPSGSGLYHLQSEAVRVEILDDAGRPCAPGCIGRVVVTPLHNFAMPLLRYEIRDYAQAGTACPCGRGLPTIRRVTGRYRNMLVMPNGEKRWPFTGFAEYRKIAPVRQYQMIQRDRETIEVRFAIDRPLTPAEEARMTEVIHRWLGHPFALRFSCVDSFPATPGGKFEDFVSEVKMGSDSTLES